MAAKVVNTFNRGDKASASQLLKNALNVFRLFTAVF